jgi:quinoprotein glucose dehydrogenase
MMKPDDPNATIDFTVIDPNPARGGGGGGNGNGNGQGRGNGRGRANGQGNGDGQAQANATPPGPRPGLPKPPDMPSGLPIQKPPYGRITAYDMRKGDKLWMVADGDDGLRNNPALKGLNLPPLGSSGRPAPLLTKSLLFLGDSSDAISGRAGTKGPTKFRAYDKATGQVLWEFPIPVGTTGAPMTYQIAGKQFIIVPVGGQDYGAGWIALALKN